VSQQTVGSGEETDRRLSTARCLLRTACCPPRLPTACFPLPTAYCLPAVILCVV